MCTIQFQGRLIPSSIELRDHIDSYWIVRNSREAFAKNDNLYAYPGITPEVIIPLEGQLAYTYCGVHYRTFEATLFAHLHDKVVLDVSAIHKFIIVTFKSRSLSSILPFVSVSPTQLIDRPIVPLHHFFDLSISEIMKEVIELDDDAIIARLDTFFLRYFDNARSGFVIELMSEMGDVFNLNEIRSLTKFSYSTLDRYVKKETGLSPKRFQTLQRYKAATEEIYSTRNADWLYYVSKYGYYDQSHFVKEIKRFTSFTPSQLLMTPGLLSFRPD